MPGQGGSARVKSTGWDAACAVCCRHVGQTLRRPGVCTVVGPCLGYLLPGPGSPMAPCGHQLKRTHPLPSSPPHPPPPYTHTPHTTHCSGANKGGGGGGQLPRSDTARLLLFTLQAAPRALMRRTFSVPALRPCSCPPPSSSSPLSPYRNGVVYLARLAKARRGAWSGYQ